jgi:hypothetical protein
MEYTEEEKENFITVIDYYDSYCKENVVSSAEYPFDDFIKDDEYKGSDIDLTANEKIRIIKYYNSSHSSSPSSSESSRSSSLSISSLSTHTLFEIVPIRQQHSHLYCVQFIFQANNFSFNHFISDFR